MKMKWMLWGIIPFVLFSCKSVPKDITYLQGIDKYENQLKTYNYEDAAYRFTYEDQIIISVSSPEKDQEKVAQFNLPVNAFLRAGQVQLQQTGSLQTYVVNKEGNIEFPVLGEVPVAGKTKAELNEYLKGALRQYLIDPVVTISSNSFYVTFAGEINSPGQVTTSGETLTILEAIARAGDLSIFAQRTNILVIRNNNGVQELGRLDITNPEVVFSPYYYLKPRDYIYVEPNDTKKKASRFGASESYNLSIISLSFTAISLITSVVLLVR